MLDLHDIPKPRLISTKDGRRKDAAPSNQPNQRRAKRTLKPAGESIPPPVAP